MGTPLLMRRLTVPTNRSCRGAGVLPLDQVKSRGELPVNTRKVLISYQFENVARSLKEIIRLGLKLADSAHPPGVASPEGQR